MFLQINIVSFASNPSNLEDYAPIFMFLRDRMFSYIPKQWILISSSSTSHNYSEMILTRLHAWPASSYSPNNYESRYLSQVSDRLADRGYSLKKISLQSNGYWNLFPRGKATIS
jgi:hypothetical protein